ncbi:MAG: hypothetical protein QOF78_1421 [Phycisphaerales bacterium]|nr:hypothetical protein [Phycisphaerales bacterium]
MNDDPGYDPLPPVLPPEDMPPAPELIAVPLPDGHAQFVDPPRIEPQTAATAPDKGTKLFVLFFLLIVPPLGVVLLAAVCWTLFKKLMAA